MRWTILPPPWLLNFQPLNLQGAELFRSLKTKDWNPFTFGWNPFTFGQDMIKDLATKTSKVSKMSKKCEKKVKRGQRRFFFFWCFFSELHMSTGKFGAHEKPCPNMKGWFTPIILSRCAVCLLFFVSRCFFSPRVLWLSPCERLMRYDICWTKSASHLLNRKRNIPFVVQLLMVYFLTC